MSCIMFYVLNVLSKKKMAREKDIALAEIVRKYPAVYDEAVPEYHKKMFKKIAGVRLVNKLMNKYRYANFPTVGGFCVVLFSLQS